VEAALAEPKCFPLKKNRTASPHPKTALIAILFGAAFCCTKLSYSRSAALSLRKAGPVFRKRQKAKKCKKAKSARKGKIACGRPSQQARKFSQVCLLGHHDAKDNEHVCRR
jgi:hypothetical protein